MKRFLAFGLATVMLMGTVVCANADVTETTTKSAYEEAIEKMQNAGLSDVLSMTSEEQLKVYAEKVAKKAAEAANSDAGKEAAKEAAKKATEVANSDAGKEVAKKAAEVANSDAGKEAAKTAANAVDAAKEVAKDAAATGETDVDKLLEQYYAKLAEKDKAAADAVKTAVDTAKNAASDASTKSQEELLAEYSAKVADLAEKEKANAATKAAIDYGVNIYNDFYASGTNAADMLNNLYAVTVGTDAKKISTIKDYNSLKKVCTSLGFEVIDSYIDSVKIIDAVIGNFEVGIGFAEDAYGESLLGDHKNVLEIYDIAEDTMIYQGTNLSVEQIKAVLKYI